MPFVLGSSSMLLALACAAPRRGVELAKLTWLEAEKALTPDTVVVIPLGAEAKEHGPHLELQNDLLLARYFEERVLERCDVVVAPTINYHFYPAFVEYPGSTPLRLEPARDLVVDVVTSLARHGPKRVYVLTTGVSTVRALEPAREELAKAGILMRYTKLDAMAPVEKELCTQERGTHADEGETSMMLVIAPDTVDMSKAVKDCSPKGEGGLSRDPNSAKTYSPSGVWGDATLATRAKGERLCAAFTEIVVREIEELRKAPLPK
ncbi:MAG: creatininase family protein [Planctomycetes bacterium]|nr:creatininase family protein [Planctomycetota bacterium]